VLCVALPCSAGPPPPQASALVLSWFGIGSLYLSLVVIFQLALDTINVAHKDQLMWVFTMWYTYLVVIQVRARARGSGVGVCAAEMCTGASALALASPPL
jgi:hypothetical protein